MKHIPLCEEAIFMIGSVGRGGGEGSVFLDCSSSLHEASSCSTDDSSLSR